MGFLSERFCPFVQFKGREYKVIAAYDAVLRLEPLMEDEDFNGTEKMDIALKMLLAEKDAEKALSLSLPDRKQLLEKVMEEQIRTPERPKVRRQEKKTVDFELDGEYIYASFIQDYGIDLIEEQGKLHWKKFIALFEGLSDSTKIKNVMRIRSMEIPEPTKYNQKQRQELMELQSYYALPVKGGGGKEGLDQLFDILARMAKN